MKARFGFLGISILLLSACTSTSDSLSQRFYDPVTECVGIYECGIDQHCDGKGIAYLRVRECYRRGGYTMENTLP